MKSNNPSEPLDLALLEEGLSKLGIGGNSVPLIQYIEEIELFNPAYGLVKVKNRRELIVKHILDSLAPVNMLSRARRIADVGSGAGLPGIPLAICMPGAEFTLIERMGRRAGFLRDALAVLGLCNVIVAEDDMKTFSCHLAEAERFDLVVYRAFKPLDNETLKGLLRLLVPGGIIAAYKGRRQSVEEEMMRLTGAAAKGVDLSGAGRENLHWEIIPLAVPFLEEERHLLLIHAP